MRIAKESRGKSEVFLMGIETVIEIIPLPKGEGGLVDRFLFLQFVADESRAHHRENGEQEKEARPVRPLLRGPFFQSQ
jgi:hypothetical protein